MKFIGIISVCWLLFINVLSAQTQRELCLQIDSLNRLGETRLVVARGNLLRLSVVKEGIKDTLNCVRVLLKVSSACGVQIEYSKGDSILQEIAPFIRSNSVEYADWLVHKGMFTVIFNAFEPGDSMVKAGLQLHRKFQNEHSLEYIWAMLIDALMEDYIEEVDKSIKACLDAISICDQAGYTQHTLAGQIYAQLGVMYKAQGNYSEALEMSEKANLIMSQHWKPDNPRILFNKVQIIKIHLNKGDIDKSVQLIEDFKMVLKASPNRTRFLELESIQLEAMLQNSLGQYHKALKLNRELVEIAEKTMPFGYSIWKKLDLALELINVNTDHYQEATKLLNSMLESVVNKGTDFDNIRARIYTELSRCTDDPQIALPLLQKSVEITQRLTGRLDCGGDTWALGELSTTLMELGRLDEAEKYLSLLDSLDKRVFDTDLSFLQYLDEKGALAELQGKTDQAWSYWLRYANLVKKEIREKIWRVNALNQFESTRRLKRATNILLSALSRNTFNGKVSTEVLNFRLFSKCFLLSTSQRRRQNIVNSTDPELQQWWKEWLNISERLAWCYTQPKDFLADKNINVNELEQKADSIELLLMNRSKDFERVENDFNVSWQDLQQNLKTGEAALEIIRYQNFGIKQKDTIRYAAFIITPNSKEYPTLVFFRDGEHLEQVILEKFLNQCSTPEGEGKTDELYTAFWKKLEPQLQGVKRIFVSADGVFHKLNLAAIRLPNGLYLADKMDIQAVFSLKDILKPKKPTEAQPKQAFLMGNPMFSTESSNNTTAMNRNLRELKSTNLIAGAMQDIELSGGLELAPLPNTALEVLTIAELLKKKHWQTTVLTGVAAKETALKSLKNTQIVHLATHGYFLDNERAGVAGFSKTEVSKNPMLRSMLFFTGAQQTLNNVANLDSTEDGVLTAYEAQQLQLEGTELVVLSACETAKGKVQNGEGVFGLQRALCIAGAQSLLLSLWDVDDKVGRIFMTTFYEKWLNGLSKAAAFRETQLTIKMKYPKPFYWAGFVLIGN
jgi:CHAT domain-containing protein